MNRRNKPIFDSASHIPQTREQSGSLASVADASVGCLISHGSRYFRIYSKSGWVSLVLRLRLLRSTSLVSRSHLPAHPVPLYNPRSHSGDKVSINNNIMTTRVTIKLQLLRPDQTRRRDVRGPEWARGSAHLAERDSHIFRTGVDLKWYW
jgi:hypothetical protein